MGCGFCWGLVMSGRVESSKCHWRLGRKYAWVMHCCWTWRKTGTVSESVPCLQGVDAQARLQVPRMHQHRQDALLRRKVFVYGLIELTLVFLLLTRLTSVCFDAAIRAFHWDI